MPASREPGRAAPAGPRGAVVLGVRELARLVLPVQCPGCGRWDEPFCAGCRALLDGPVRRCEQDAPRLDRDPGRLRGIEPLPVWAVAEYQGSTRGAVVAWKDRGRRDLTPALVSAVRRGAGALEEVVSAAGDERVDVVPVPSSWGARRRRGTDLVGRLATGAAAGLADAGGRARVADLLTRSGARDQVGLGARARGRNTAHAFRLRGRPEPGRSLLLVDDVLTTGSTMAACEGLLSGSGGLVLAGLVLAATPPPERRTRGVPPTTPED